MAAAAAVSSPFSSQEHRNLPIRNPIDVGPFSPPPSGQSTSLSLPLGPSAFAGLGLDLQDIEEFDRQHGTYQPDLVRLGSNKTSSENIVRLKQWCDKQKPKIQPKYEPKEVYPQNWTAKVIVLEETFEATGLFPSKDQARDAAAGLAIDRYRTSLTDKQSAGVKRKNDERSPSPVDRTEDWISLLGINAAQKKRFRPIFEEWSTKKPPYDYFCTIKLDGGPVLEPFKAGPYPSKRDAKTACAKLAVEWLRISHPLHLATPAKRQKQEHSQAAHTGVTQAFAGVDMETPAVAPASPSNRQRVHSLVAALRLRTLKIDCQRSAIPSGLPANATYSFYDVAAYFDRSDVEQDPTLAGPFGLVRKVYGEDNAKEECARNLLPILEKIQQDRMM